MADDTPVVTEQTVGHLVELHRMHDRSTTTIQRVANRITVRLGRPITWVIAVFLILGWTAGNYFAQRLGIHALDEFPFPTWRSSPRWPRC